MQYFIEGGFVHELKNSSDKNIDINEMTFDNLTIIIEYTIGDKTITETISSDN